MKRFFSCCLALAMVLTISVSAAEADTGFTDVPAGSWYADGVEYVRSNGLMSGTSATTFSPDAVTSRSMLAAILYRVEGSPAVSSAAGFSDVPPSAYYADVVAWASSEGIISGYGNGQFGSNAPVTREQLATVLWRYAGSPNVGAVQDFTDESSISAYAADAVDWARRNGIISGVEGNRFLPQGSATRAQVAVILRNYLTMPASPGEAGDTEVTETVGTQIILTIGDLEIPAVLNDTVAAQSFKELLPFTVTASKGQYDYCGVGGDIAYDEGETQAGWKNGDIGYARGWFALFHSGEEASSSYANEMIIGHIDDSYLDSVRDLPASVEITVEFADAQ